MKRNRMNVWKVQQYTIEEKKKKKKQVGGSKLTCSTHTPDASSGPQRIMVLSIEAESRLRGCSTVPPAGGDKQQKVKLNRLNCNYNC